MPPALVAMTGMPLWRLGREISWGLVCGQGGEEDLRFADFDFEAFSCGELAGYMCLGEERVELLVDWAEAHDRDVAY